MPMWTGGAPVSAPMLVQAVPTMDHILAALTQTYSDLTLQCAVSSLMLYVPALRRRPGLAELHRENYEVSYHLTTAIGSARRILAGSREPVLQRLQGLLQVTMGNIQRAIGLTMAAFGPETMARLVEWSPQVEQQ